MDDNFRQRSARRESFQDRTMRNWGSRDDRGPAADTRTARPAFAVDNRFPATMDAALRRLDHVRPTAYAKTRNFIDGAVTRLSPYLTHGFLDIPGCIEQLSLRHTLTLEDKLIYEFAWREYFHHVWARLGDGILSDIRNPVWRGRYQSGLPADIREGATGVAIIDAAVRSLYADGYLHNHMRMWLASYIVHIRKVDWKVGAAWMYGHLLDGDLASNFLSWQWVAGTFAHKPYLFNADNVSRYAAGTDCSGTTIDTSYVDLEAIARGRNDLGCEPGHHVRTEEPALRGDISTLLSEHGFTLLSDDDLESLLDRQDVTLRHPWDLRESESGGTATVAWLDSEFHSRFPWSDKRWDFVLTRLRSVTDKLWISEGAPMAARPSRLHGFDYVATMNPGYANLAQYPGAHPRPAPRFFPNPVQLQPSFTRFFDQAMAGREISIAAPGTQRHSA